LQKYKREIGDIAKNEFGKPYLVNQKLYFNRSHSGNYIAYAISTTHQLGIDIEYLERQRNAEGILQKFFHPEQLNIFRRLDPKSAHIYFLRLWTSHEALIKMRGISAYSESEVRQLSTEIDQPLELSDAEVLLIEAPDNYIGSLAVAI
jgi:4'-phosphopantetheinyl transferase